jgi:serine/threonine protein kinase
VGIYLVIVSQTIRGVYKASRDTDVVSIPIATEIDLRMPGPLNVTESELQDAPGSPSCIHENVRGGQGDKATSAEKQIQLANALRQVSTNDWNELTLAVKMKRIALSEELCILESWGGKYVLKLGSLFYIVNPSRLSNDGFVYPHPLCDVAVALFRCECNQPSHPNTKDTIMLQCSKKASLHMQQTLKRPVAFWSKLYKQVDVTFRPSGCPTYFVLQGIYSLVGKKLFGYQFVEQTSQDTYTARYKNTPVVVEFVNKLRCLELQTQPGATCKLGQIGLFYFTKTLLYEDKHNMPMVTNMVVFTAAPTAQSVIGLPVAKRTREGLVKYMSSIANTIRDMPFSGIIEIEGVSYHNGPRIGNFAHVCFVCDDNGVAFIRKQFKGGNQQKQCALEVKILEAVRNTGDPSAEYWVTTVGSNCSNNLMPTYDCGSTDLFGFLWAHGPLHLDDRARLLEHLCSAVLLLHSLGWVHMDLKIENVLVVGHCHIFKVLDPGSAKEMNAAMVHSGTRGCIPPEVLIVAENAEHAASFGILPCETIHASRDAWPIGVIVMMACMGIELFKSAELSDENFMKFLKCPNKEKFFDGFCNGTRIPVGSLDLLLTINWKERKIPAEAQFRLPPNEKSKV